MAESSTASALRNKRDELERIISSYEKSATTACRDLAHINATLEILEREDSQTVYPSRLSIARLFRRGELFSLCEAALSDAQLGLDTRELSIYVIRAKGMDERDQVLRKAVGFRVVQVMLRQEALRSVKGIGKRCGVRVWLKR